MTPDRDPARIIAGGQPLLASAPGAGGHIATNLLAFTRLLRRSGLPLGPGEALSALAALNAIDIGDRRQVHAALRAVMVHRREHFELFDQAFQLFWRDPEAAAHAAAMAALDGHKPPSEKAPPASRRLAEAMQGEKPKPRPPEEEPPRQDMSFTVSDREKLQKLDFEAMSAAEIAAAKQEIRKLTLPLDEKPTRRFRAHPTGRIVDLRATLRQSLKMGGEILTLARKDRLEKPPPLVVLCDISGSMARYAQILLHFLHAVTNDRDRVHVFLFGTRLTNVTRELKRRDIDEAIKGAVYQGLHSLETGRVN